MDCAFPSTWSPSVALWWPFGGGCWADLACVSISSIPTHYTVSSGCRGHLDSMFPMKLVWYCGESKYIFEELQSLHVCRGCCRNCYDRWRVGREGGSLSYNFSVFWIWICMILNTNMWCFLDTQPDKLLEKAKSFLTISFHCVCIEHHHYTTESVLWILFLFLLLQPQPCTACLSSTAARVMKFSATRSEYMHTATHHNNLKLVYITYRPGRLVMHNLRWPRGFIFNEYVWSELKTYQFICSHHFL